MEYIETLISNSLSTGNISLLIVLLVFAAGLLTSTTPCVYPMIPITVGVFAIETNKTLRAKWLGPFVYVGGLAIIYGGLGVFAALTGKMFGQISTNPIAYVVVANACLLMAAWMMGWINIPQKEFGQQFFNRFSNPYIRLFLMGVASGLVAAPCTAPVLGMLLMFIATSGDVVYGSILMVAFAYGLGSLLLVIALSTQLLTKLPNSGRWMSMSKWLLAGLMLITAEYFLIEAGKLLF